jgi:3-deoxy-D-manno-octulosonic-acid transferase
MLIYRSLMALALPVLLTLLLLRRWRGVEPPGALAERLGWVSRPGPGPAIWLHGASNGELTSARWVVEALQAALPGLQVLVTCNTASARAMVQGWSLAGVPAALAPLDTAGAAARVLARWQPRLLVVVEGEFWPARLAAARDAGVPVAWIGARISERAARRWRRFGGFVAGLLAGVAHASAQDAASAERLLQLGMPAAAMGPVLMLKAGAVAHVPATLPFPAPALRERTLLAASTHEGEEALVLEAFASALAAGRLDHLILAPRHPRRAGEVVAALTASGLGFVQRSAGEVPGPGTAVHLADTMGEMGNWYAMAGVCVIGGSFAPKGGHTPWEPAAQGAAILHGPSTENFAEPFAALDAAGGALLVADAAALAAVLRDLSPAQMQAMAGAARAVLAEKGDTAALVAALLRVGGF